MCLYILLGIFICIYHTYILCVCIYVYVSYVYIYNAYLEVLLGGQKVMCSLSVDNSCGSFILFYFIFIARCAARRWCGGYRWTTTAAVLRPFHRR
jgi:hypothetical protein